MSPAVLKHAMEPLFTTKDPGKSTELGLATIHSTVPQSGGFVAIDSTQGTSVHQCDMSTGIIMWRSWCRVAPPSTNSRRRE